MKLSWLGASINSLSKDRGLYRFCSNIQEDKRKNMLSVYVKTIFEARAGGGLFWFLPDREGNYSLAFFPEEQYNPTDTMSHLELWNKHVAPLVADHFGLDPNKLLDLYDAFPRGRMEVADKLGEWRIGIGEYPPGWDEGKLLSRLKVNKANCSIEADVHWATNTEARKQFGRFRDE